MEMEWLPAGAKRIEYLEISNNQYFVVPGIELKDNNFSIEVKLSNISLSSTWQAIATSPSNGSLWYGFSNDSYIYRTYNQSNYITCQISLDTNTHIFKIEQSLSTAFLYFDNNLVGSYNGHPITANNSNLNIMTDGQNSLKGKIYYFKLKYNGSIIYDMVPIRINSVGYLYDKISRALYENRGSGSFTLGPDK